MDLMFYLPIAGAVVGVGTMLAFVTACLAAVEREGRSIHGSER